MVKDREKIIQAIQVCYHLTQQNKDRELNGLVDALEQVKLKEGLIITFDQDDHFEIKDKKIKVLPVWKWLLEKN